MTDAMPGFTTVRVFDAPRERVWQEWTEAERFADWFGGPQAEVPLDTVTFDARAGSRWRATMLFGEREIHWQGVFREVVAPERLVFTITDRPGGAREDDDVVIVDLVDLGDGRTEMRFQQRGGGLPPDGYRAAQQGWGGFFDRIAQRLAE